MNGYQLSPRVTLQPGDRFRATGGPYWRSGSERISMAARGVFTLVEVLRRRGRVYLLEPRGRPLDYWGRVCLRLARSETILAGAA
jgi:hypothetical protein